MSVPDRHVNEATREIQAELLESWKDAKWAAEAWRGEEQRRRERLELAMGDADAATINGRKVLTNRPSRRIAVKRLMEDYPALVEHYMRPVTTTEFDEASFVRVHRDIAEKYRVRSFRAVAESPEGEKNDQGS
jgi:hypothetical protein